jgi:hypothetical protein
MRALCVFASTLAIVMGIVGVLSRPAVCAPTPKPAPKPARTARPLTKAERAKLEAFKDSAPADEYFGKMKMSYLGINNTFRDQAIRAGDHTTDSSVIDRVHWAEDALNDWRRKYAHDPQLARSLYLAFLVDSKIWVADFQQRAAGYLLELRQKFANTYFGKQARADLQRGMTMHFYAPAQPCQPGIQPTPQPVSLPTADPKNNIKVDAIPVPCYTPQPPSPSPAASASTKP